MRGSDTLWEWTGGDKLFPRALGRMDSSGPLEPALLALLALGPCLACPGSGSWVYWVTSWVWLGLGRVPYVDRLELFFVILLAVPSLSPRLPRMESSLGLGLVDETTFSTVFFISQRQQRSRFPTRHRSARGPSPDLPC